jgi:hypothetical protein
MWRGSAVAARTERSCLIMADLPGPKIRIGKLMNEPLSLGKGNEVILTAQNLVGTADQIPVEYKRLPESVNPGSLIFPQSRTRPCGICFVPESRPKATRNAASSACWPFCCALENAITANGPGARLTCAGCRT